MTIEGLHKLYVLPNVVSSLLSESHVSEDIALFANRWRGKNLLCLSSCLRTCSVSVQDIYAIPESTEEKFQYRKIRTQQGHHKYWTQTSFSDTEAEYQLTMSQI